LGFDFVLLVDLGSSPQVRGRSVGILLFDFEEGLIPAGAGQILWFHLV